MWRRIRFRSLQRITAAPSLQYGRHFGQLGMLCFLMTGVFCWGPLFHQAIARQFAQEQFPGITDRQLSAFVLGAIYADGIDKRFSHHISSVISKINQIHDTEGELYWFMKGLLAHIAPDTFAHAGKSRSFIVAAGIRHYFSELVVDSLAYHTYNVQYMSLTPGLREALVEMGLKPSWKFQVMHSVSYTLSKMPLHRLLPEIQHSPCPKTSYELSRCTFMRHVDSMLEAMREVMPRIHDPEFDQRRVQEIATRLLWDVGCCEYDVGVVNETISEEQPLLHPPLTSWPNKIPV